MKFGEHRGGMYVHATGMRGGQAVEESWHLLAEGEDGPYIPSMAIEAVVRKLLAGETPAEGARPATHALALSDYHRLFEGRAIFTGFRSEDPHAPLYQQVLGSAFAQLPAQVQALHADAGERRWHGTAEVRRGRGLLARMVAALIGFPPAASAVPVSVGFTPERGGERWTRDFGGRRFSSWQRGGQGRNTHLLVERFGIVDVALALVVDADCLRLVARRWSCLGIPLPKALLPGGNTFETERDGRFVFDVEIAAPWIGLIVGYRGSLVADPR
jgi:hypothetical protein